MFIERLLNQGNAPLIEQAMRFGAARHKLILENVANASTPNYVQKDLSETKFQQMLQERSDARKTAPPGSVQFDDIGAEVENPSTGVLFHDRNNRSMEQLMTESAKNSMRYTMMVELMRRQYGSFESALKERIG